MTEVRYPKFAVVRETPEGWVPYVDADGDERWRHGPDSQRAIQAAIQDAQEFAEAEPGLVLAVVDPAGAVLYRVESVTPCPF